MDASNERDRRAVACPVAGNPFSEAEYAHVRSRRPARTDDGRVAAAVLLEAARGKSRSRTGGGGDPRKSSPSARS